MTIEHKQLKANAIKLAAVASSDKTFSGYLAGYGNVDSYGDVFEAGAFAESLAEIKATGDWPPLLLNHGGLDVSADDMLPVGIYLDFYEDDYGLRFDAKLAGTTRGTDIHTLLTLQPRPAIKGMSVGYIAQQYRYESDPSNRNREIRKISQAKLLEGSIVTFPANKNAQVLDIKAAGGGVDKRKLEAVLRDVAGLSQREAKALMAGGFEALAAHRDGGSGKDGITDLLLKNIRFLEKNR